MKNRQNNVLSFPTPPEEPGVSTIIVQIADERFAIHFEIEDLPLVPLPPKRETKNTIAKIVDWPRLAGASD